MNNILSLKQACEYLQMSKSAMYKLTSKKLIPHFKPGGKKIYFKKCELEEWISKGKIPTSEEVGLRIEFSNDNPKGMRDD